MKPSGKSTTRITLAHELQSGGLVGPPQALSLAQREPKKTRCIGSRQVPGATLRTRPIPYGPALASLGTLCCAYSFIACGLPTRLTL